MYDCPKTSFGLFREILSTKEPPCKGRQSGANNVIEVEVFLSFSCREIRCSTPRYGPTSATGTTKPQTHPAPLSALADGTTLYL